MSNAEFDAKMDYYLQMGCTAGPPKFDAMQIWSDAMEKSAREFATFPWWQRWLYNAQFLFTCDAWYLPPKWQREYGEWAAGVEARSRAKP